MFSYKGCEIEIYERARALEIHIDGAVEADVEIKVPAGDRVPTRVGASVIAKEIVDAVLRQ